MDHNHKCHFGSRRERSGMCFQRGDGAPAFFRHGRLRYIQWGRERLRIQRAICEDEKPCTNHQLHANDKAITKRCRLHYSIGASGIRSVEIQGGDVVVAGITGMEEGVCGGRGAFQECNIDAKCSELVEKGIELVETRVRIWGPLPSTRPLHLNPNTKMI